MSRERLRILLVEDRQPDAELLIDELRAAGYDPDWVRVEDEEGYRRGLGGDLDVILADFSLPRFDTRRALEILNECGLDVPFLVVSGTVGEDAAVSMIRAGAADYLLKDRLTRLGPAVSAAIETRRLRRRQRAAERRIAESEERYRVLVEHSPEPVAVHVDGRFVFVNPAAAALLGARDRAELLGRYMGDFVHPDSFPEVIERAQRLRVGGEALSPLVEKLVRLDGRVIEVEVTGIPILYDGERAALLVARDVTEQRRLLRALDEELGARKKMEDELREALVRAKESDRLKSAFLGNISHEIRTPLNVIVGYNEVIADSLAERGDTSCAEFFEAISRAEKRLLATVHEVLDLSKIETGTFDLRPVELRPAAILRRLAAGFERAAREKGLSFSTEIEDEDVLVTFDEYSLEQALTNVVENAIKFTEAGTVRLRLYRGEDGPRIEVRDTGVGIDPAHLSRLFHPFSQEDSSYTRRFEGVGIGLALAHRFLELNGASLSVESRKREGTTFTLHLGGRFTVCPVLTPAYQETRPAKTGPTVKRPRTMLLVEDDVDTQRLLARFLERHYRVLMAASAAAARAALERAAGEVDLVLMDLSLAGAEDGLELTRSLKADPRWGRLPIIALTAHAFEADRDKALAAGCDAYLAKPVTASTLLARIESLL